MDVRPGGRIMGACAVRRAGPPALAITLSLFGRFHSRQPEPFAARVLAAMRKG